MGRHNTVEHILAGIDRQGPDDCWEWQRARSKHGYGVTSYKSRVWLAHRIAYMFHHGVDPGEDHVLHTCDNPPCCNPAHLFPGDPAINSADKVAKGRQSRHPSSRWEGEKNPKSVLTDEQVREIRNRYELYSQGPNGGGSLAREFSTTTVTISNIVTGKVRLSAGGPIQPERKANTCPRGHEYTEENTYTSKAGPKVCRTCRREDTRRRRESRSKTPLRA